MTDTVFDTKVAPKVARPKLYAVVLLNDDFTTMEFVEQILEAIFGMTGSEAASVTMDIHKKGKGVAGVYTLEVAETKAMIVESLAMRAEFPLKAEVAPESGND